MIKSAGIFDLFLTIRAAFSFFGEMGGAVAVRKGAISALMLCFIKSWIRFY